MDIIFAIVGLIFVAAGLYFVAIAIVGLVRSLRSRNWSSVQGIITASDVKTEVGTGSSSQASYKPVIEYEYEVRGTQYTGNTINFSRFQTSSPTGASRTVRNYPVDTEVTVYHHPWQPEKSTLETGTIAPHLSGLMVGSAIAVFGTFFGLGGLYGFDNVIDRIGGGLSIDQEFVWTYFLPFATIIGAMIMAYGFLTIFRSRKTRTWPTVEGTIIASGIVKKMGSSSPGSTNVTNNDTYKAEIAYEYEVDGRRYVSNRVHLLDISSSNYSRAESIQSRYKTGAPVRVYYSPKNPEQALLEPGGSSGGWLPILVGTGFVVISLIMQWFHSIVAD